MARINTKFTRGYINGVDVSGYSMAVGSLDWMFETSPMATWSDEVKNVVLGQCSINAGTLNAVLDNDAAGLFNLASANTNTLNLMVAMGTTAVPVAGNPIFAWQFENGGYKTEGGTGFVSATVPFAGASYAGVTAYKKPWGYLLHALNTRTGVNSSTGLDDSGASSSLGGVFVYHLLSSDGTVTLKAQHASTNSDGSFADVTGATSGSITAAVSPKSGMVGTSTTLTINRYTRWQLEFGTATTATFALGFIRNTVA